MLSWPALHIFSPYTTGLNFRETRNCLITARNCHCTCTTHVSANHRAFVHHLAAHTTCSHMFKEALPMPKPSPISNIAHTTCPHAAHQVTAISPLVYVHALANTHQPNALHTSLDHHSSPTLTCTQATKHTHKKLATKPPMSCTTT